MEHIAVQGGGGGGRRKKKRKKKGEREGKKEEWRGDTLFTTGCEKGVSLVKGPSFQSEKPSCYEKDEHAHGGP